jgi:tetratricopeptide (TPR) repeat protein
MLIPPPDKQAPQPGVLDALFVAIVLALAFLLASTPARNSDLWLHLASGRALIQGQHPRGSDPFASTTAGVFWVNPSWLSDVALYELYELGGGKALVVAKSVLVAVLSGLFFCFRRRGTRMGMTALAATAAVLTLGPWLLLQPYLVSLLGVVLTLYLLERPSLRPGPGPQVERARKARWLLVPLFALWANLDAWFLLGPALVGLYAAGEAARRLFPSPDPQTMATGDRRELGALVLLSGAGLAACLLTPYHYHIFAWPTPLGLSHAEQEWMHDPLGRDLVVSPFAARLPAAPAFASPGGWAYCLLLVGGLASFGLRGWALHPGRLLVWLALAVLSLYQARAIPLFAVAAGPLLALNLQDWALGRRTSNDRLSPLLDRASFAARGVGLLAGLVLLALAWPGWLQPRPYQPRAWALDADESLVRMARRLQTRAGEQKSRPDHLLLTFSPEAAHYLAWFCPEEKGFFDSRWPLFDRVAGDYVLMRRSLLESESTGNDTKLGDLLDAYRLDRVLVHDPDLERTIKAFSGLLLAEQEWDLLAIEGASALFGRHLGAVSPSPWKAFDYRQAAYHPDPDRRAPLDGSRSPQAPGPFDPFFRARDDRSADRGEAALHLAYFELQAGRMQAELRRQWLVALAAGMWGGGPGTEPAGTATALAMRLYLTPLPFISQDAASTNQPLAEQFAAGFMLSHDRGPPEALLLAVRAARRALAVNPDDAGAFLLLGETYLRLARLTREQSWQAALPELAHFRHTQALSALEQAVLLRPDLDQAHALLAQLYLERGHLDRALDHLRVRVPIAEQMARKGGPNAESAARHLQELQADVETIATRVRRSQEIYDANTQGQTDPSAVLARARLAMRHGLTRKALEMLLRSHPAIFGSAGALLQLDLMLEAGQAFDVRAALEPQHETMLGFVPYHSLRARAAAACGDYAAADAELDILGERLRHVEIAPGQVAPVRSAMALRVGDALLARPVQGTGPAGQALALFFQFNALAPLGEQAQLLGQAADFRVLRGLLALEAGAVESARQHLSAALAEWGGVKGSGVDFRTRPIAQYVMGLLKE